MRSRTHGFWAARYDDAERRFQALLDVTDLDAAVGRRPQLVAPFERVLAQALAGAYAAQNGRPAVDDMVAAHRLWVEWLRKGRARKLALVAERVERPVCAMG
jgi:hypothetical protein